MTGQELEIFRSFAVFADLSDENLEKIFGICRVREISVGEILFVEQSDAKELYIIKDGEISIELEIVSPEEQLPIYTMKSGEVLGEMSFVDGGKRSATAKCVKDAYMFVIDRGDFEGLISKDYKIGYIFMRNLTFLVCQRIRRSNQYLLDNVSWGMV